jgi:signal transduction histidine kinase
MTAWIGIYLFEPNFSRRYPRSFPIYLLVQSVLICGLLSLPEVRGDTTDYFAILFAILSMQVVLHVRSRRVFFIIALFTPVTVIVLLLTNNVTEALVFGLIYTVANALWASYALAARRSLEARASNQELMRDLQETNRQLKITSEKMEQLAAARERGRLARDLHDSVTQTLFSMNLTTQSAILLFQTDTAKVSSQLERLSQLTQSALSELQLLISELRPQRIVRADLATEIRRNLAERHFSDGFQVDLVVEGNQPLSAAEEDGLFRIIQEAINNIVKHARVKRACIRLHLTEPYWVEIEDHGQGFDPSRTTGNGKVGLSSMRERASEINWSLQVTSSPQAGTRVRVEKEAHTRRLE